MNFSKKSGKKRAAVAAVICFVAAIAITGTYTFNDYKKSKSEKEIAMTEEHDLTVDGEIVANETDVSGGDNEEEQAEDTVGEENAENTTVVEAEDEDDTPESGNLTETANTVENVSVNNAANVSFGSDSLLLWPVSGALLMDYSMDKTVYFKTLDQYKYNPAIVIAAAENDQVIAGIAGMVKSIDQSAQTGTTVNIDLGNGYEAFYGQLQKVAVKTGDYVEATTTLGYIAEPTKYYSSEGSNLYFEMRKDGQPVDPKEYLVDYTE